MNDWLAAGLILMFVGLIFTLVGLPMARGRVPRNSFYGYRIPSTVRDDRVWYPVNTLMGIWMIWGGVMSAVIGLLLVVLRNREEAAQLVLGIGVPALIVCLAAGIYRGWRMARAIDEQVHNSPPSIEPVDE